MQVTLGSFCKGRRKMLVRVFICVVVIMLRFLWPTNPKCLNASFLRGEF